MATAVLGWSKGNKAMEMYDTEIQRRDTLRRQQERTVHAWMRAAALASGTESDVNVFQSREPVAVETDLGRAVESKKRDNLALGEALVSIGLIGHRELSELRTAQSESDDLVGSLMVASAIRSRLGEMLLNAKRITSSQLEFALEMQRHQGGLLGEILVSLGWLDQETLDAALIAQAHRNAA
ncbi:MAG: hypothetical protein M3R31_07845 [Pseudomonadota bacterium]|nr:hypothetical protein [Pseudomonadota bacterium]